jgi:hypothetical protein
VRSLRKLHERNNNPTLVIKSLVKRARAPGIKALFADDLQAGSCFVPPAAAGFGRPFSPGFAAGAVMRPTI